MSGWAEAPFIYEINTWTWLHELSSKLGRPVSLDSVPDSEWEQIASLGMDAVWLMGVWERSPEGIRIARFEQGLEPAFRTALPDYTPDDVSGSPYCIRNYSVDNMLGGPEGLAVARRQMARHKLRLLLDFVPNHVSPDHPWITERPEYFVQCFEDDRDPAEYFFAGGHKIARGRDPHFPPWPDTAQLNAFAPELRDAVLSTLNSIAAQCDGVRCDMAMLALTGIFERTWGARAGNKPPDEYWIHVIAGVRRKHPDFLFIAEAYWDLEWTLHQLGFDYCYDKVLYDRLAHENAEAVRGHLSGDLNYQRHLIRFLENHDEPRVAATFPPGRREAAALAIATLPGAKLFFHGQIQGRKIKLPVQLGREPIEPVDNRLLAFYGKLFEFTKRSCFRSGEWRLCRAEGWPDNRSCRNLLAWVRSDDADRALIVINYSGERSQGRIIVSDPTFRGSEWRLTDAINGQQFDRDGDEMCESGLFVDLEPWQFHALVA